MKRRLGYPTYGEDNLLSASPKYVNFDWEDAVKPSGDAQYQTWTWTLEKVIEGYRFCSVVFVDFLSTVYANTPRILNMRVNEIGATSFDCTTIDKVVTPTWSVANESTSSFAYADSSKDSYLCNIEGLSLQRFTFTFANEDYIPVPVADDPDEGFYFYLGLKFWN